MKYHIFTEASLSERDRLIKESCAKEFIDCQTMTVTAEREAILSAPVPLAEAVELPDAERGAAWYSDKFDTDLPDHSREDFAAGANYILDLIKNKAK